ncbi:hypothetical protein MNBD_ALPHA12-1002, partial [hydrothermal vent metagenome]
MNNPAAKEPSMDEILSSIRQIIADEDAPAKPAPAQQAVPAQDDVADFAPAPVSENDADAAMLAAVPEQEPEEQEPEPLALSPEQMIGEPESKEDDLGGISFNPEAQDPALAAQAPKPARQKTMAEQEMMAEQETMPEQEPVAEPAPEPAPEPEEEEISLVVADDVAFDEAA